MKKKNNSLPPMRDRLFRWLEGIKEWFNEQESKLNDKQRKFTLIVFYLLLMLLCLSFLKRANQHIPFVFSAPL